MAFKPSSVDLAASIGIGVLVNEVFFEEVNAMFSRRIPWIF